MLSSAETVKNEDILRGKIFRVAFPFLEDRPLNFFEKCDQCNVCEHKCGQTYCGRVFTKTDGFEDSGDKTLYVINRFKARYAMILSTGVLNNSKFPNVIVAPIVGIHDDEINKPNIKDIMERSLKKFTAYYLDDSVTGKHCYIDLGKIQPIPKNWLLQEKFYVNDKTVFDGISERLGLTLAQKKLIECERCKKPCEKCELKQEIETLRQQLESKKV